MNIPIDKQIAVMEKQLSCFDTVMEKLTFINDFFKPDPIFEDEAIMRVVAGLCRGK